MDERVKLLRQVQQCDFTLYDLQLYLDTHPACRRAMEQYEKHLRHRRELEEECGLIAGRLEPLATLYPTPAYCDEKIWIFTAKELTPGHVHPDEDEFITAEWVPLARAEQMVLAGEIEDAKTQIAILKYTALRRKGEVHE